MQIRSEVLFAQSCKQADKQTTMITYPPWRR